MRTAIPSPDLSWASIAVGPLTLHTYALCLLAGIAAATWLTSRRLTERGGAEGAVLDIAMWAVPLGIVGARIYHVLTHWGSYFGAGQDPLQVLYIWEGGIAVLGSLIGGAVGAWIGCRRTGVRLWSFADALAPAMLLAQAIGRLGNWFNHELYGRATTLPWGLEIPASNPSFPAGLPAGTLFHPLFLYELLWNLLGVAVIVLLERRFALRWGRAFGVYLIWYGSARVWLETLRIDPTRSTPLGLPANVWGALLAVALGVAILVVQTRRHPEPETSVYSPGRSPAELGATPTAGEHGSAGHGGTVAAAGAVGAAGPPDRPGTTDVDAGTDHAGSVDHRDER
ncbi:prolipoprotein diacylglyceryl transferase [Cellulomonas aerilata]|uniref:Phosphatidylglycerol--prolipoprotein diacylglyceryl transferase n=1 Tax=Cellulomonas aerilata TaxID=515326 RepID=A0A512D7Y1_9CELL|nr:prolipoprotein diacylglyceryl transferase [Cellulomonas aerilata]GEO32579.1 prolipoprotein diacylglyceryl transferase 2 [Cellulomonas aerilata]